MTINTSSLVSITETEKLTAAPDEDVQAVSDRLIAQNLEAYKELAK